MGGHRSFFAVGTVDEDRRPISRDTVRRVVATFRPYRGKVGLVALTIAFTSGLGVANPLLIKAVFDNALHCTNVGCNPDLGKVVYY